MLNRYSLLAAAALTAAYPVSAHAESSPTIDVTARVTTQYICMEPFNGVCGSDPSAQVEATANLTPEVYVAAYAYADLEHGGFRGESAEYGAEAGYQHDLGNGTTAFVAVGRYSNYQGQGFRAGDWYGKIGIRHGRASVSISALSGETDSVIVYAAYELPVGHHLTVRPSLAILTAPGQVNPGLELNWTVAHHVTVGFRCVLPDDGPGPRHLEAAATAAISF